MEEMVMTALSHFYAGKKVLLTGHTGFKGSWLALWLRDLGADVYGYALAPDAAPNLYEEIGGNAGVIGDIRDAAKVKQVVLDVEPDIVFHLAAQPLVRLSYAEPMMTLDTNLMGTLHVLEAVRALKKAVTVIVITTDKCYENLSWDYGYRESDPLGGHDVYSMSKAVCELAVASWRRSFFETDPSCGPIATARAGNVIGGGDYAQDRIVPDWVRAMIAGKPLEVRNPHATRPWQHVLDCLSGYLWLGIRLTEAGPRSPLASAFNFGPPLQSNVPVGTLVRELLKHWAGDWVDGSDPKAPHEASRLHLSIDKAAALLDWHPTWDFKQAIAHTVQWYTQRHVETSADMLAFSRSQIHQFTQDAAEAGAPWAKPLPIQNA